MQILQRKIYGFCMHANKKITNRAIKHLSVNFMEEILFRLSSTVFVTSRVLFPKFIILKITE